MSDGEKRDVARESHGTTPRSRRAALTPKQRLAGAERARDPGASEGVIMRRATYSASTSRNPTSNLGEGGTHELARRVVSERGESLRDLEPKAIRTLSRIMDDESEAGGTRVLAAASTLKLAADVLAEPPTPRFTALQWRGMFRRAFLNAWIAGARYALAYGSEAVEERRNNLKARTEAIIRGEPHRPPHDPEATGFVDAELVADAQDEIQR